MGEVDVADEPGVRFWGCNCRRGPGASHDLVTSRRRLRPRRRSAGSMIGLKFEAGRPELVVTEDEAVRQETRL